MAKLKYKVKVPLTKSNVLSRINEFEIFVRYLNRDPGEVGLHTNPLREDNSPGCSFYTSASGRLFFKDWATGESYDCFKATQEKFGLSFYRALEKINEDFELGLGTHDAVPPIIKEESFVFSNQKTVIQIIPKEYTQKELGYWKTHGISRETLKKWKVYSVDRVYIDKKLRMRSTEANPIFGYVFPDSSIKIYRPLAKREEKWKGNSSFIFGWNMLPLIPVDDFVIITSSFKDAMYLDELGYNVVAPQAESYAWKKNEIDLLKSLFENIIVFYDNDGEFNPPKKMSGKGKQATKKVCKKYGLSYILIPDGKPKDVTDLHKKYNKDIVKKWLKLALNTPKTF